MIYYCEAIWVTGVKGAIQIEVRICFQATHGKVYQLCEPTNLEFNYTEIESQKPALTIRGQNKKREKKKGHCTP